VSNLSIDALCAKLVIAKNFVVTYQALITEDWGMETSFGFFLHFLPHYTAPAAGPNQVLQTAAQRATI